MTGMKLIFTLTKGESEGYTVKSREDKFPISNYPLEQTEFFYSQKQGIASLIIFTSLTIYTLLWAGSKTADLSFIRACPKGRDKLGNEKNKVFDYSMFNYRNGRAYYLSTVHKSRYSTHFFIQNFTFGVFIRYKLYL